MNAEQYFAPAMVELLDNIQRGNKTTAKALIDNGIVLNSHGNEGVTPLLWLITQKDQQAVELALTLGADPNFPAMVEINRSGPKPAQPLALIAGNGDSRIFNLLLEHGADPNSVDQSTGHPAIFGCIDFDNWEQLNTLIEHNVNIEMTDHLGRSAALYAAYIKKFDFVLALVRIDASPVLPDKGGVTVANMIESLLERNSRNPAFRISDDVRNTKALLIEKGVTFPPLSPQEVREHLARGEPLPQ